MTASERTDLYKLLGVAPDADSHQMDQAFRSLARRHHPDTTHHPTDPIGPNRPNRPNRSSDRGTAPSTEDTQRFQEILSAYAVLRDPIACASYDRTSPRPRQTAPQPQTSSAANPLTPPARPDPALRAGPVHWAPVRRAKLDDNQPHSIAAGPRNVS